MRVYDGPNGGFLRDNISLIRIYMISFEVWEILQRTYRIPWACGGFSLEGREEGGSGT